MVWIYESPPYTPQEKSAYRSLRKKLQQPKFVDELIKLISLYAYIRRLRPHTVADIEESAYYDVARTRPIFDSQTAKKLLHVLTQSGGDSKYPYFDTLIKGITRDYIPFGSTIESIGSYPASVVEFLKNNIPFGDLMFEIVHSGTEFGITSANGVGEAIGGPVGLIAVAPFTAIAAGVATALAAGEGDLGQAVTHIATWVPGLGLILNKGIVEGEKMAKVLRNHPVVASYVPYMTEYHATLAPTGGKRLSTKRRPHKKWTKTRRRTFANL